MMMMMMKNKQHNIPSSNTVGNNKTTRTSPKSMSGIEPATTASADGEVMIKIASKKPFRSNAFQGQVTSQSIKKADESNNRQSTSSPVKQTQEIIPSTQNDDNNCRSNSPNNNKVCNCKYSNNHGMKQKEREMEKLRKDLAKCQNDLRDEIEKRGQSSSARAACDKDKFRLLKDIRELDVSKRRLESALEEASSALKKKTQEVRLVKEAGKQELANIERSANLEVKKLLEDLKAKDHLLAIMDRNQYSDRSNQIKIIQKQQDIKLKSPSPTSSPKLSPCFTQTLTSDCVAPFQPILTPCVTSELHNPNKHPRKGEGTPCEETNNLRKKICDLEKQLSSSFQEKIDLEKQNKDIFITKQNLEATIARLRDDNIQLNSDLNAVQYEVKRLNDSLTKSNVEEMIVQFDRLKNTTGVQKILIKKLQRQIKNLKEPKALQQAAAVKSKKTVRFTLPGYSNPIVNGRVAYKEDMRFLFEAVTEDDDEDDDDDGYHFDDNEVRYYFDSINDDEGIDDEEDDDDDEVLTNKTNIGKSLIETSVNEGVDNDPVFGDDDDGDDGDDDDCLEESSTTVSSENPESDETSLEENGDYKLLMKEHLQLEQSIATLAQSIPPHSWLVEKESLQIAIMALETKSREYQEIVDGLKKNMEELKEKNEELEFQVLEFEGSGSDIMKKEQEIADFALIEKNNKLEQDIRTLQVQLLMSTSSSEENDGSGREDAECADAETQCCDVIEEVLDGDLEQTCEANLTSSSSGFDDLSSDDETSLESMPHDHEKSLKTCAPQNPKKKSAEYWMKFAKTLEVKLACSKMKERQLQDKLVLLCEEKNRIIRDFDRYTSSDTDSLIELDSGIDTKSLDGDVQSDDRSFSQTRASSALSCSSSQQLRLDFSICGLDDSFHIDTPNSGDLCFPRHVQSLTVEDETDALHQRICHLEKDCELLKEIIDMDEGIIRDLQFKVDELEGSEKNLSSTVERLERVEKVLRSSESATIEENSRLKTELTRSRSIEDNLQSQLNLSRCDETQLRHKLDEILEELRQTEARMKRKTMESERERKTFTSANEKLEDYVGELEAVVELLKKRNQNLQRLCEDTNNKLVESEVSCKKFMSQAERMEQQRDAFVARIQILEKEKQIATEKFNNLGKNLDDRSSELEMAIVEIKGLRACLDSSEHEMEKWMKKVDVQADVEVLLMREMDGLRGENEILGERLTSVFKEMMTSVDSNKSLHCQSSAETQTEPSFTIFVKESNGDDDETIMAVTDDDDASMDDISDHELDHEDLPLDDFTPMCPSCSQNIHHSSTIKWGSLDNLWYKMGAKNSSFGNSKAFRDKFTQTLLPLVPYLRKMHDSSLMLDKLDTKSSSKVSLIPLNAKYFNQSNASNSYISKPPSKIAVQSGCSPTKSDLLLDRNIYSPCFDLLHESVSDSFSSISSPISDGPAQINPQSPGTCALH